MATLNAMGVALHNIYGTDIDKHAVSAARQRYPAAHFENCPFWEALDVFPQLKSNFGCAFIDLCSPLREEIIEHAFDIGQQADLLGYEFMCGREMGNLNKKLDLDSGKKLVAVPRLYYLQKLRHNGMYFNAKRNWGYASHSAAHFGKSMALSLGTFKRKQQMNLTVAKIETTWEDVRSACIAEPSTAQLWNVTQGTLAAWRAHESRGTYQRR